MAKNSDNSSQSAPVLPIPPPVIINYGDNANASMSSIMEGCDESPFFNNTKRPSSGIVMENLENLKPPRTTNKTPPKTTTPSDNRSDHQNIMSLVHHKWRKMWKRDSAEITPTDPSYKTIYLGNVVTNWAKGEGCLDRPASALWKNHVQGRGSIKMLISVAPSGLKAQTREHGLTEYWANRLTWCGVPPDYPKLFCWIYRHEGRKLKQELRCHAVLCAKEAQAQRLAGCLRNRLTEALFDFKKEKILRQNARLSIVQSLYNSNDPSSSSSAHKRRGGKRTLLSSPNSQNYKPPLERSKSAPKLSCIEESEEDEYYENEEEEEVVVRTTTPEPIRASPIRSGEAETSFITTSEEVLQVPRSPLPPPLPSSSPPSIPHRKASLPNLPIQVIQDPEGGGNNIARRPHTVPASSAESKLRHLPYMTGYDKVMQLLDMEQTNGGESHLLQDDDEEEDQYSDPLVASSSSPASSSPPESVIDDEDNNRRGLGRLRILRGRNDSGEEGGLGGSTGEDEIEINDNVSDESGYSEDATKSNKTNNTNNGGAIIIITSSNNQSSRKDRINLHHHNHHHHRSNNNNGPFVGSLMESPNNLAVYDNLCFEI